MKVKIDLHNLFTAHDGLLLSAEADFDISFTDCDGTEWKSKSPVSLRGKVTSWASSTSYTKIVEMERAE